jgi:hypothetical protein
MWGGLLPLALEQTAAEALPRAWDGVEPPT